MAAKTCVKEKIFFILLEFLFGAQYLLKRVVVAEQCDVRLTGRAGNRSSIIVTELVT
jgi:hypothetical protein